MFREISYLMQFEKNLSYSYQVVRIDATTAKVFRVDSSERVAEFLSVRQENDFATDEEIIADAIAVNSWA